MTKAIPTLCSWLSLLCLIAGCEQQTATLSINITDHIPPSWIMLTKHENDRVIFQPCDANTPEINIRHDTLHINWGQEESFFRITSMSEFSDKIMFTAQEDLGENEERFSAEFLDDDKKLLRWYIWLNDTTSAVFIDSRYANEFQLIKQPCSECWGNDVCDEDDVKDSVITMTQRRSFENLIVGDS